MRNHRFVAIFIAAATTFGASAAENFVVNFTLPDGVTANSASTGLLRLLGLAAVKRLAANQLAPDLSVSLETFRTGAASSEIAGFA